jgi:hypothetical protein
MWRLRLGHLGHAGPDEDGRIVSKPSQRHG